MLAAYIALAAEITYIAKKQTNNKQQRQEGHVLAREAGGHVKNLLYNACIGRKFFYRL